MPYDVIVRNAALRWPVPARLHDILSGQTLQDIDRRAKYLLLRFDTHFKLDYRPLRRLFAGYLGDVFAYQPTPQHGDAYDLVHECLAESLTAAAAKVGPEAPLVIVGHSLGGHAVIEAGARLPSPKGALIFGSPPVTTHEQLGGAFFPMPGGPHFLTGSLSERDVCHWQASVFYSEIPAWFAESVARTDPAARADLAASLGVLADEVGMVREYPCPIGLIQGQFERTVRQPYLESLGLESKLWRNAIQVVDESNHFTQFDAAPAFNALVAEFIAEHV